MFIVGGFICYKTKPYHHYSVLSAIIVFTSHEDRVGPRFYLCLIQISLKNMRTYLIQLFVNVKKMIALNVTTTPIYQRGGGRGA